jgi:DNA (cytosine-5)-methyltransferase 1
MMKSMELFAGAGGLGIGLHRAGFRPVRVIEWNRYCCDTIEENKRLGVEEVKSWHLENCDIRTASFKSFADKVSLVSGGPPCQPFSVGGKHAAQSDDRDMFPQAIRAVREIRPKAFIFENVKGLTRSTFSNYFEYIRLQLEHPEIKRKPSEDWEGHLVRLHKHHTSGSRSGLQYRVVTQVLNAADYGVPQKRQRVFLVGFRQDLGLRWSFPTPTHSLSSLAASQETGEYWERHKVAKKNRRPISSIQPKRAGLPFLVPSKPWRTVRDAISDLPDPELHGSKLIANHKFQPGARVYVGHSGSELDEPAKTLKAGVHGVPGGENMLRLPNGSVRYFTVRECARLQGFPDAYTFHGSWTETMRQLGNAVPVDLAQVVGDAVARHLV